MAHPIANTFSQAEELVTHEAVRDGNVLRFADDDELLCLGDVHGNRKNLSKAIAHADLAAHPDRRLVLQELLHGGPADPQGGDRSVEVLLRAVRLKLNHPEQVFFLMGNHDLAQFTGNEIAKNGLGMCKAFEAGLEHSFGPAAGEVRSALYRFLRALPLAGQCPNGLFISHSLPAPNRMHLIDWDILQRPYRDEDLRRGGSVYEWTWGRGHTREQLDQLADRLGASYFLMGHQPVEAGYEILHERAVIISSDEAHGMAMIFRAGERLSGEVLPQRIHPVVTL